MWPSGRAHFGFTRRENGGIKASLDWFQEHVDASELYHLGFGCRPEEVYLNFAGMRNSIDDLDSKHGSNVECFYVWKIHPLDEIQPDVRFFVVRSPRCADVGRKLQCRLIQQALLEEPNVEPVALAEPLKIRVISKGPPLLYWCLRPVQKQLWQLLAHRRCFRSDGPITPKFLMERDWHKLEPEQSYLSGDYTAATDGLDPSLSEHIVHALANELGYDDELRTLLLRSLTGHVNTARGWTQKWGQLMGSVTSFPVLCIANLAICSLATHFNRGKFTYAFRKDLVDILCNGDDCLAKMTADQYSSWQSFASVAGMKPSLGKTYFGRDWFQINSTLFERRHMEPYEWHHVARTLTPSECQSEPNPLDRVATERAGPRDPVTGRYTVTHAPQEQCDIPVVRERNVSLEPNAHTWRVVEIPFLNLGLLYGLGRSGTKFDNSDDGWENLAARHSALIRGWTPTQQASLTAQFVSAHAHCLPGMAPWFLPREVGGVGLTPIAGYTPFQPSFLNLKAAALIQRGLIASPPSISSLAEGSEFYQAAAHRLSRLVGDEVLSDQHGSRMESAAIASLQFSVLHEPRMWRFKATNDKIIRPFVQLDRYWRGLWSGALSREARHPTSRHVAGREWFEHGYEYDPLVSTPRFVLVGGLLDLWNGPSQTDRVLLETRNDSQA